MGEKIHSLSMSEIQSRGLERFQGHLEIFFAFLAQNEGGEPLRLRKNSIEFILQALKERLTELVDHYTVVKGEAKTDEDGDRGGGKAYQLAMVRGRTMKDFMIEEEEDSRRGEYDDKEVKATLFPQDNFAAIFSQPQQVLGGGGKARMKILDQELKGEVS